MSIPNVAKYQKWILFAILAQIILYAGQMYLRFSVDSGSADELSATATGAMLILFLCSFAVVIFAVVSFILLMIALDRPTVSMVLGAIAMFIPLVGLIVLLVVNQRATSTLQANGIRVGLMGAKNS